MYCMRVFTIPGVVESILGVLFLDIAFNCRVVDNTHIISLPKYEILETQKACPMTSPQI